MLPKYFKDKYIALRNEGLTYEQIAKKMGISSKSLQRFRKRAELPNIPLNKKRCVFYLSENELKKVKKLLQTP